MRRWKRKHSSINLGRLGIKNRPEGLPVLMPSGRKRRRGLGSAGFDRLLSVFHHFRPKTCSMVGLPVLMPSGRKRRRTKMSHLVDEPFGGRIPN